MSRTATPQRARKSRKPTCCPNPPIVLLTGPDLTGKGHEAATGSASELVGMTYWIQVGGTSGTADYYGQVEGARYEIVPHDGSFTDIVDAIRYALAQPARNGKRNMIVVDDVSSVWELLSDEVACAGRSRAERRAHASGRRALRLDDPYVDEERDLWVAAKDRWGEMLWTLRQHNGPTLLIARQEIVTAYENDKPTVHTTRRIRAEKNLTKAVDAVVEFHAVGEAYVTGLHSMAHHWEVRPGWTYRFEGVDHLLRRLGYEDAAETRAGIESRPEAYLSEPLPIQRAPAQQGGDQSAAARQPGLSAEQAASLVRLALESDTDPRGALQAIRTEWGTRFLQQIYINTPWGWISADLAITRALEQITTLTEPKNDDGVRKQHTGTGEKKPEGDTTPHQDTPPEAAGPGPAGIEADREHKEHEEPQLPVEDTMPPPPDPQAEEPPAGESQEETTAAEEPQVIPSHVAANERLARLAANDAPRKPQMSRGEALAYKALEAEARLQDRVMFVTDSGHFAEANGGIDLSLMALKKLVLDRRPAVIDQLEQEGHQEVAAAYRNAPQVETQIERMFAPCLDSLPTTS
ncbi:hypothetical protein ACFU96_20935 [Streptomyces sp. NPDC057620]|uniref:hypothetical protein n=1 Tax=Streptomyces sp. NPDC057620 TaxID=3346185 RepID=UPI0036800875